MPPIRRQPERAHTKHQPLARPTKSTVSSKQREKSPSAGLDDPVPTIMAAIYWDIIFMTTLFKMLCEEPIAEHLKIYDEFWDNTLYTVEKAVWDHAHPPIQGIVPLRFARFIKDFGWRFFAICAYSEAFVLACEQENDTVWNALTKVMADEERSIDVFARTRGLNWQATLLRVASQLPELEHVLAPEPNLAMYHPGQVVITENGRLRLARFQGKTQVHIEKLAYNQKAYGGAPDPTLREMEWGRCRMYRSFEQCECVFIPDAGDLVELTEYWDKGIGVRALTNIKEGGVLGEYIGEFVPETDKFYKHTLYDMRVRRITAQIDHVDIAGYKDSVKQRPIRELRLDDAPVRTGDVGHGVDGDILSMSILELSQKGQNFLVWNNSVPDLNKTLSNIRCLQMLTQLPVAVLLCYHRLCSPVGSSCQDRAYGVVTRSEGLSGIEVREMLQSILGLPFRVLMPQLTRHWSEH